MKHTLIFSASLAGALLLGLPAAKGSAEELEGLAVSLREKAEVLPAGRAKALKSLAARLPLIESGEMPVDTVGRNGTTSLMLAVVLKEEMVVEYLLEQGADPYLQDAKGRDAFTLAADDESMRQLLSRNSREPSLQPEPEEETAEVEAQPEPVAAPSELAVTEPEPAQDPPPAFQRSPGDGKGPLLSWEEAESYLEYFISHQENGRDYVLDAEGNRRCLGMLRANWAQVRQENDCMGIFSLAGALFGTHRATPLISFLLEQAGDARPKDPFEWYYQAHCAYRLGQLGEDEFCRQRELARPAIMLSPQQEKNLFRYLRMCAAGGETQLVLMLLQKGVDPSQPGEHSGDHDIRIEQAEIPEPCREELRHICALPVAAAALGGHVETLEVLLQHQACDGLMNHLLAYASLSRNAEGFEAVEQLLLARGARHSALSLICACAAREDEQIMRIQQELNLHDQADLTRALLVLIAHGVTPGSGNRCAIAEMLVKAGADVHALEGMPAGMATHPLYTLFASNGTDAIALYSTLNMLGLNEKKVLSLTMNAEGDTLLSTCDATQRGFLYWNMSPRIVIDAATQRLTIEGGVNSFSADISTGIAGLGGGFGSGRTPVGKFSIYSRHGENAPLMTMFRLRQPVGTWPEAARPGEDGILTRVLTLKGEERDNADTQARNIYIHGTPDVEHLGRPASHGCIRLSPEDMVQLFELSYPGMEVIIIPPKGMSTE